jgi:hypothetical protein
MRRMAATGLLTALALAGAGCGQDANARAVRDATTRFFTALARQDGPGACAQLSADTVKALEQDEKSACGQAIEAAGLAPSRIARVAVYVTNAKVDLANGASVYLEQTASGWKLSALGCRATDGDPKVHPLACSVES